jgi:pyruvate/2-oxoglutarate dehydrogenase complex dihydrolipoamide acyltransferase (E2) component
MPPLGQTSDELRLLGWHKAEGEAVDEGELLLEIETDKATLDVEASVSGTLLRIDCREGETVTAGAILGWLGEPGEQIVEPQPPTHEDEPVVAPPQPAHPLQPRGHDRVLATPAARMLARDLGVDLSLVTGTGPDGRIERRDIEAIVGG